MRWLLLTAVALAACGGAPETKQCAQPPEQGCFLQDKGGWFKFETANNIYGWAIVPCECAGDSK